MILSILSFLFCQSFWYNDGKVVISLEYCHLDMLHVNFFRNCVVFGAGMDDIYPYFFYFDNHKKQFNDKLNT